MTRRLAAAAGVLAAAVCLGTEPRAQQATRDGSADPPSLVPTAHPAVAASLDGLWYAPPTGHAVPPPWAALAQGARLLETDNDPAAAMAPLTTAVRAGGAAADYARLYLGRALNLQKRYADAEAAFAAVVARPLEGALPEDAALGLAEAREGRRDFAGAVSAYERLLSGRASAPQVAWWRLGRAAEEAGLHARGVEAYRRVYYDYPLSTEGGLAEAALKRLGVYDAPVDGARELARADVLFGARRWAAAQTSYRRAVDQIGGTDRERAMLRAAACDVQLNRAQQVRSFLRAQMDGPFGEEAGFYYVTSLRSAGNADEYVREVRRYADRHRSSAFAEELLNALATHFIVANQDSRADEVFRLTIERYPSGRFAERAYWRSGWWAYRDRRFAEAASLFDRGAERFPRSDYRPSWLYWGGRAWQQAKRTDLSVARLSVALTDYQNSYYGRLARRHLTPAQAKAVSSQFARPPAAVKPFPTQDRVADLLAAGLNRAAIGELQYAQRVWGDSPALTATLALAYHRAGNLRTGINTMKRAYPQWMAVGGESLPREIQEVVFPLNYWPLLQKYAAAHGLDPYLVAALVAQESTFDPVIRSSANAVGLMQVLPSTGREFARKLKMTTFTPARLTHPETNVRLGTAIFTQAVKRFGGVHFALAAYNAGEHRVATWKRDRPDLPQDEFIDDIPFPETQNYVKRILGTAEDYRRLYGPK